MEKKPKGNSFTSVLLDKAGAILKRGMSPLNLAETASGTDAKVFELQLKLQELELQYDLLRQEKALQDQIISNLADGFFIIDAEARMLVVNETLCAITGYKKEELIGKIPPYPYWPPEEYETIGAAVQKKYGKEESHFELTFKRKNGERFPAIIETFNLQDHSGKITHCFATIKDLSILEKAYKGLEESEQRYKTLFENTSDCIYKSTPEGKIISANPALVKLLGYESEEALKAVNVKEAVYFHPEERDEVVTSNLEVYRLKKKDGTEVWVEDQGYFTCDENNNIIFHEGILRDITERKKSEDELRQSELKFRTNNELLQSILDSPKGIIIFSLDNEYCYKAFTISHKETMKKIWGVDIEIGMNMLELISNPDDREKAKNHFDLTLKGEQLLFVEEYGDEALFRTFWETRYSPIYSLDGNITGLTVFVTDITERKQDEERLKKSEKALNEAQKLSKIGSWEFFPGTGELIWSEELYRIFKLEGTPNEKLYEAFRSRVHRDDLKTLDKFLERAFLKGEGYVFEHRIQIPNEPLKYVFCKGEPVFNDQKELVAINGITLDITEKKAQEKMIMENMETLNKQNEELHRLIESNVRLENFAYIASHDLKSPVRTINSFTGLLKTRAGARLDEEEHKFLDFIANGANEIQNLIEDLLDYSKVKSKGFNPAPLDVNHLLKSLLATMSADIEAHNAVIKLADVFPAEIHGDRTKIWQVFQNLIINAMKFHKKGVPPEIIISGKTTEEEWQFSVQDNGIGIDAEFHEKIFVLFQQLNTKEQFKGTGLGLAICKKIIDQHNGRIWVESEPGQGAVFYFTLPRFVIES